MHKAKGKKRNAFQAKTKKTKQKKNNIVQLHLTVEKSEVKKESTGRKQESVK